MVKPIYYSSKMKKYYFNNTTLFGDYYAEKVYGCENFTGSEVNIQTDKNGRKYFLALVKECVNKEGHKYYVMEAPYTKKSENEPFATE